MPPINLMREVLSGGAGGRWYADGSDVVHIVPGSRNLLDLNIRGYHRVPHD